jgi:hypothetical protein
VDGGTALLFFDPLYAPLLCQIRVWNSYCRKECVLLRGRVLVNVLDSNGVLYSEGIQTKHIDYAPGHDLQILARFVRHGISVASQSHRGSALRCPIHVEGLIFCGALAIEMKEFQTLP